MQILAPRDPAYPPLLATITNAPTLHVRGSVRDDDALAIAIVGARRATPYGIEVAETLAADLAARGVTIVSGLARGIDTAAHRGALAGGGRTIAVLGTGIDHCYPPENRALADRIAGAGALVSQFAMGTPALAWNFPARNRTIAGLSLGVVVVEAAERSGALITAALAGDLGREVFAVPGRLTSETARGPHGLLRDGATLVRSWMDVVQEIPSPWRNAVRDAAVLDTPARVALSADERAVLGALAPDEPRHIEDVIARCALPSGRVGATLLALELGGHARQLEGQRWLVLNARAMRA